MFVVTQLNMIPQIPFIYVAAMLHASTLNSVYDNSSWKNQLC